MKPFLDWNGARLEGTEWQGIRYLSLQHGTPESGPGGATLTVHLNRPADGLSAGQVQIEGGRRLRDLAYAVRFPEDQGSRIAEIAIDFATLGDHATYYVSLLGGGDYALHPFFALADFVFAPACEAGDCRAAGEQALAPLAAAPAVDLLTRDYAGFQALLADHVRVSNPHWADLSRASFERVLVDLLAHHGDLLGYYQDRVAGEGFLDTATQRYSVRQHGVLLGYELFDGVAATTVLGVTVSASGNVPAGLQVQMARRPDEAPVSFSVRARTRVDAANNQLVPAAWPGATQARIAAGETRMLLWGHATALRAGQRVAFVQGGFSQIVTLTEVQALSLPGWVEDPAQALATSSQAVTEIAWGTADRLARDLYPWDAPDDDPAARDAGPLRIYGNLVDAVHGEHRVAWLEPGSAVRRRDVIMHLDPRSSIVTTVRRGGQDIQLLRALRVPEGPVLFDRAEDGTPALALEVTIDGQAWQARPHLHRSSSQDRHYVATTAEDGSVWLQLGDGRRGHEVRVAAGRPQVKLRYRVGDPIAGNCAAGTLTRVIPPEDLSSEAGLDLSGLGSIAVTNVVPGSGGRQAEPLDAARQSISASLHHGPLLRAVSVRDYADAAAQVPGVARASARALGGLFDTVLVLVDPEGQEDVDAALAEAVQTHLDRLRMVGREVRVAAPAYLPLDIELAVCAQPGWPRHDVRDRVQAALQPGTAARPGFFHPDKLSFAESVELGDVLALVQSLPGVRSVKAFTFRPLLVASAPQVMSRIHLGTTEVARLDADPSYPENGRLVVRVVGLDRVLADPAYAFAVDVPAAGDNA